MYSPFGIESDSTVYNTFSFFSLIISIIIIHVCIALLKKCLCRVSNQNKCACCCAKCELILDKVSNILTFGYYIRVVLEMSQFLLICSIKEINEFNDSQTLRIISLIFAVLVLIFCLFFIFTTMYLFLSSYDLDNNQQSKLGEFYCGIQMCKKNKIYIFMFQCRRVLFITMMITLPFISSRIVIGMLSFIQLIYLIYIVILRPFKEIKCNIIEIFNEFYFFLLLSGLIFLNFKNNWNENLTNIYIWSILFYFILISSINIISLISKSIKKCASCCSKVVSTSPNAVIIDIGAHHESQSYSDIPSSNQVHPKMPSSIVSSSRIVAKSGYLNEERKL